MRTFLGSTLLVAVLFVAGCGGGGGGNPSAEAAKAAAQVVKDAVKYANAATSVHISGQVVSSGQRITIDLSTVKGKGAMGSLTVGGDTAQLVLVGEKGYMRASSDFWTQFVGADEGVALEQALAGRWLEFPTTNAQFGSLVGIASDRTLFNRIAATHGALTNQGTTMYNGEKVVAIDDPTKGTLYVAASGTPYPVALVGEKSGSSPVSFDDWNKPVSLIAPKDALDYSQLVSG